MAGDRLGSWLVLLYCTAGMGQYSRDGCNFLRMDDVNHIEPHAAMSSGLRRRSPVAATTGTTH